MLLLFVLAAVLIGLGFFNPVLWVAAAVLLFGCVHYGRGGAGRRSRRDGPHHRDYRDYRDYRERQDRWERRYRRGHGKHQVRRQHEDRR